MAEKFYCKIHHHMCDFIYGKFEHPVIRQQHLDINFITIHYLEVMEICEHHDLVKLMTLKQDYNDELVKKFFPLSTSMRMTQR
jgi:hypothetical protein